MQAAHETPVIYAEFETFDGFVTGSTSAPVKRVEHQDDGSLTVVLDYWPSSEKLELEAEVRDMINALNADNVTAKHGSPVMDEFHKAIAAYTQRMAERFGPVIK